MNRPFSSSIYLYFKTSPGAQPFIWKWVLLTRPFSCKSNSFSFQWLRHQDSFWNTGKKATRKWSIVQNLRYSRAFDIYQIAVFHRVMRTRNDEQTRAAGECFHSNFEFSQTFTSVTILNSMETQGKRLLLSFMK